MKSLKKVYQDSPGEDLVLPNNKLNSNIKTKTQRQLEQKQKSHPHQTRTQLEQNRDLPYQNLNLEKSGGLVSFQ